MQPNDINSFKQQLSHTSNFLIGKTKLGKSVNEIRMLKVQQDPNESVILSNVFSDGICIALSSGYKSNGLTEIDIILRLLFFLTAKEIDKINKTLFLYILANISIIVTEVIKIQVNTKLTKVQTQTKKRETTILF